jgi:Na+:H+ antiporter, NhaA family
MSLFIGALAFPEHPEAVGAAKLGTLAGSLLSGIAGYVVLRRATNAECPADDVAEADRIFARNEPAEQWIDRFPAPRNLREDA